jgi:hypothetical protein
MSVHAATREGGVGEFAHNAAGGASKGRYLLQQEQIVAETGGEGGAVADKSTHHGDGTVQDGLELLQCRSGGVRCCSEENKEQEQNVQVCQTRHFSAAAAHVTAHRNIAFKADGK